MISSLVHASLRAFLITLSILFAILLAAVLFALAYSSAEEKNKSKIKIDTDYKPLIVPNAHGVRKEKSSNTPVILELKIFGPIGTDSLSNETVRQQLVESREGELKGDRVKAIFLHINSPGGTVDDADGIYEAILEYKHAYDVPVFAYLDGMCASGGLYVSCAADKVFSRNTSIVGSIGVLISPIFNVSQVMEKIGVNSLTLSAGIGKDSLNPFRPWKEGEQDNLKNIVDEYYQKFVDIVARSRPEVDRTALIKQYGAHIFLAEEAAKIGLVDFPDSSRSEALIALVEALGIEDDEYQVITMQKKNWLQELITEKSSANYMSGHVQHHIDLGDGLPSELRGKFLYLYRPGQ